MKMAAGILAVLMMGGVAGAQEECHWMGVTRRFYRINADDDSEVERISLDEGAFHVLFRAVGGEAVVEAAMDMTHPAWVSQEHLRVDIRANTHRFQPTDPSCIPQTGQQWSQHEGDDGDLKPGHSWPHRFTVQANTNLVVDHLTGLMWTRNAGLGRGTWDFAVAECFHIPRFGYEDWRLPTIRELESLTDMGGFDPALPLGHPFNHVADHYWSSTADIANTHRAWIINFMSGAVNSWMRTNTTPAYWPVRTHTTGKAPVPKTGMQLSLLPGDDGDLQPGVPWPIPRFTVQANTNLVFDNLVGRMWTRDITMAEGLSWGEAMDFCNALTYGGFTDWRLPTRREAWSVIDFGRPSFLPEGHPFTRLPESGFWTSTSFPFEPWRYAWGIQAGYLQGAAKTNEAGVWPVRGNW